MELEKVRAERIAANRKELERLGLGARPAEKTKKPLKKKETSEPLRRSKRQRGLIVQNIGLDALQKVESNLERKAPRDNPSRAPESGTSHLDRNSTRLRKVDISALQQKWLGNIYPATGKDRVVQLSAVDNGSGPPKFSRLSGVTEWENAFFLWVNIFEPGASAACQYQNAIHGQRLTWWASKTKAANSPTIERLTGAASNAGQDLTKLLFCRLASEPYVYCGRLEMEECFLDEHPVRFSWKLKDFDSIKDTHNFKKIAVVSAPKKEEKLNP